MVNCSRSSRRLTAVGIAVVLAVTIGACAGPTIPAAVLRSHSVPTSKGAVPNVKALLIPLAQVAPNGWTKEPTPPATLTHWQVKGCQVGNTNFAEGSSLPDFYEMVMACPTTADVSTLWSHLNWSAVTAAGWHATASYPRYGTASRSFTENYSSSDGSVSCTAYAALLRINNVLAIVGYCDDGEPQGAIKASSETWVGQVVDRIYLELESGTTVPPKAKRTTTTTAPKATTTTRPASSTTTTATAPASTTTTAASTGATKSFTDDNGTPYTVTFDQVIDPAQPADPSNGPDSGTRFIAVEFTVTDKGSASLDNEDADNSATVIGSNDQTYTSALPNVSECTDFDNGQVTLVGGESVTGCVTVELPDSVTASAVQWTSQDGFGTTAEWSVG